MIERVGAFEHQGLFIAAYPFDHHLDRFLAAYRERLEAAYPEHPFGNALIPTKRLFLVAQVAGRA